MFAASSILWPHLTSHRRGWQGCGFPFLPRPTILRRAPMRPPSSCASNFPTCSGSPTAQDHGKARVWRLAVCCLPPRGTASASRIYKFRGSMAGLSVSAVNASLHTSRWATHDSGSRRFATPFLYRTFTDYHLPVCAGALPYYHTPLLSQFVAPPVFRGLGGLGRKTVVCPLLSRQQRQRRKSAAL